MAMKPGKLLTFGEVKTSMKSLQKTYGHQTLQGADEWWRKAHNEVVRLWSRDHVSKWKLNISSSTKPLPPNNNVVKNHQ